MATDFRFEFSDLYYAVFLLAAAVGTLFGFIGCIAWARCLGSQHRVTMAMGVFSLPWLMLLLGYPIGGVNIHGPAVPAMLMVIPATILAIIILIMAVVSRSNGF